MKKYKTGFCFLFLMFLSILTYGQKGYYVDKDYRIKKYQYEIINYLVNKRQFTIDTTPIRIKDYYGRIFVYKTIELFPWSYNSNRPSILLIKFGSLGDHADHYWGLLESDSKLFFLNTEVPDKELLNYMDKKKYNKETQDIILYTLKLYKKYEQ